MSYGILNVYLFCVKFLFVFFSRFFSRRNIKKNSRWHKIRQDYSGDISTSQVFFIFGKYYDRKKNCKFDTKNTEFS